MTDPDDRLKALFAADLPPARDPAFQAEFLAALARRHFLEEIGWLAAASLIGAVVLAALWPLLAPALANLSQALTPAAVALAVAVSILGLTLGLNLGLAHDRHAHDRHEGEADVERR